MAEQPTVRPGQTIPTSGIYGLVGSRGGRTGSQCDSTKGNPAPPTPKAGMTWKLDQPAKHAHKK